MRVLGLDPAAHFGWAVVSDSAYESGGTLRFDFPSAAKQKKGLVRGLKWSDAQLGISELISDTLPDVVVIESVRRHVGSLAAHSYGFFKYTIEAECARKSIRFEMLEVSQWKKVACGSTSKDKDLVARAMAERFNIEEFKSDDHSDAVGLAYAGTVLLNFI